MKFVQIDGIANLYTATEAKGVVSGTMLYLLRPGVPQPPATIEFVASWASYDGCYIFLRAPLDTAALRSFAAAAERYLNDPRMIYVRFAWFQPPDTSGLLSAATIAVRTVSGGKVVTEGQASISFGSVSIEMPAGVEVSQELAAPALRFTPAGTAIALRTGWGSGATVSVSGTMWIPMTDIGAGALRFALDPTVAQQESLDIGLRMYYAIPPDSSNPGLPQSDFFLGSMRYPIFDETIAILGCIDPLAPLDPARTFFEFVIPPPPTQSAVPLDPSQAVDVWPGEASGGALGGTPPPGLQWADSHFRSIMGDVVKLGAMSSKFSPESFSSLVFATHRSGSSPSPRDPLCLVPRGTFFMWTERGTNIRLMCGLSGVEYAALPGQMNYFTFMPGQDAFAAGFYPGKEPGYTSLAPEVPPTTSYARVGTMGRKSAYVAQPDQAVLYNYGGSIAGEGITLPALDPLSITVGEFPWPDDDSPLFPIVPYAGLDGLDLDAYSQMESQVIAPARRLALAVLKPVQIANTLQLTSKYSTTPQGLLVAYVPGQTTWSEVVLAKMGATKLALTNVSGRLMSAFQSNKLFLVISSPESISGSLLPANALITLAANSDSWTFDLDPAKWAAYGTIMIVKYTDISIRDLARDPGTWAFASAFNTDPADTSSRIAEIIADADPDDSDFSTFLDVVTDPAWNGVLILNATSPVQKLPPDLASLAAGIDQRLFVAHHVGINASRIEVPPTPGNLNIADSSIFGLINYHASTPLRRGGPDFQFRVQRLKILFLNSAPTAFSSVIDLQINRLFGEPAALVGSDDNVVEMFGVYEKHVVDGRAQGSYSFQTKSGDPSVFTITSGVLRAVQLTKGQFVSVTSSEIGSNVADGQFVFWGLIDFKALDGFDMLSFGREAGAQTPAGLSFGNLVVDMQFDRSLQPPIPVFTLDASHMTIDMAGSTARKGSFFDRFPLTLAGFTQATQGAVPTGLGYMGMQTPLNQSALVYPWYGLTFNLNLGTPGSLAAQTSFVGSLIAAWSPGGGDGSTYSVFTGMKLPGSNGSKRAISLQGLFEVSFKNIAIIAHPEKKSYILLLYGIGFTFMKFSFPPSGQVNFVLFGDPDASGRDSTIGWYAAYAKDGGGGKKSAAAMLAEAEPVMLGPGEGDA